MILMVLLSLAAMGITRAQVSYDDVKTNYEALLNIYKVQFCCFHFRSLCSVTFNQLIFVYKWLFMTQWYYCMTCLLVCLYCPVFVVLFLISLFCNNIWNICGFCLWCELCCKLVSDLVLCLSMSFLFSGKCPCMCCLAGYEALLCLF